jgi:hypothetical protein
MRVQIWPSIHPVSGLSEIALLMPPPTGHEPEYFDWSQIEEDLGIHLPSDYKWFLERYGMGEIDDFLLLFHPTTTNRHINLKNQIAETLWALRVVRDDGDQVPYTIFPEPGGVVPWARTDNGDVCYWLTHEPDPDSWIVVVNESRGPEWEAYGGSATEFLAEVLSGRRQFSIFPENFPSPRPTFTVLPEA